MREASSLAVALETAPTQKALEPGAYEARLQELLHTLAEDVEAIKKSARARETAKRLAAGVSASTVDAKEIELEVLKNKEEAFNDALNLIATQGRTDDFEKVFEALKANVDSFPRARTAKLVRQLIDACGRVPKSESAQMALCSACVAWCETEERTFLKHRLQTKLASLYEEGGKYQAGLALTPALAKQVRKFDDKLILVEIYLVEAKLNYAVNYLSRANASLTAAKASANAVHCPPALQADIDLVAGLLHLEDSDWSTAFSYFYEAFDVHATARDDAKAIRALKYMLLSQLLSSNTRLTAKAKYANAKSDAPKPAQTSGQSSGLNVGGGARESLGLKYYDSPDIQLILAISRSFQSRSLAQFQQVLTQHQDQIKKDHIVARHLKTAADQLLEQNIIKAIEPYDE